MRAEEDTRYFSQERGTVVTAPEDLGELGYRGPRDGIIRGVVGRAVLRCAGQSGDDEAGRVGAGH
jgi:hypothetical protein